MPTFRKNQKLGTKVPLVRGDDLTDGCIDYSKLDYKLKKKIDGMAEADGISQADLTKYLQKTEAAGKYLSKEEAGGTYLTKEIADATYAKKGEGGGGGGSGSGSGDYLKKTDAATIYLTKADAEMTYAKKGEGGGGGSGSETVDLTEYLKKTEAANTYLTQTAADSRYALKGEGGGGSSGGETNANVDILISDLDLTNEINDYLTGALPSWRRVVLKSGKGVAVGTLEVFSDFSRHQLVEILRTNYTLTDNGEVNVGTHIDGKTFEYRRFYNYNIPYDVGVEKGHWSAWKKFGDDNLDELLSSQANELKELESRVNTLETNGGGGSGSDTSTNVDILLSNLDLTDEINGYLTGTLPSWRRVIEDSKKKMAVGTLEIFSDSMRHQLTEILKTNYTLTETGEINNAHQDGETFTYRRFYNHSMAQDTGIAKGHWSAWKKLDDDNLDKLVSGHTSQLEELENRVNTLETSGVGPADMSPMTEAEIKEVAALMRG